jgi:hypothetical protein
VISAAWGDGVEALLEVLGERAACVRDSVARAVQLQTDNEFREQFADDDDRMLASILMCAQDRDEVFRLVGEWFGDLDRQSVFRRWTESVDVDPELVAALVRGEAVDLELSDTIFRCLLARSP